MNFTLLNRKFENVNRIEYEGQEVEEIRWNGETVWKRDPCFIAVTDQGKLLICNKTVDLKSIEIEIEFSYTPGNPRNLNTCCIHKNRIFVGGDNGSANERTTNIPIVAELIDLKGEWNSVDFYSHMNSGSVKFMRSNNECIVAVLLSADEKTLQIHRSEDGLTWEKTFEKTSDSNISIYSFTYCNGKFNFSTNFGVFVSENAESWIDLGFVKPHYDIFYHNGKYIESEMRGIYYGYDLENTTKCVYDFTFSGGFGKISYHNGLYFCGANYYSEDGFKWNRNNYPDITNDGKEGVFYDGIKYHLIGEIRDNSARVYATSEDGINWSDPTKLSCGLILDYQCSY